MASERALDLDSSASVGRVRTHTAGVDLHRLLTIEQVAAFLSVSPKTVRRLVTGRRLPCIRLGRVLRFQQADLFRFVEARKE